MSPMSNPLVFDLDTLELTICLLIVLTGILIFQIARLSRSVKVIQRMLQIRQEVARSNRRSA